MVTIGVVIALWATMLAAGNTPIGRSMREWFVIRPALRLSRVTKGEVLLVVAISLLAATVLWFGGRDGVNVLGMSAPDLIVSLNALEVGAYLDAIATVVALATVTHLKGGMRSLVAIIRPAWGRRLRSARQRPRRADRGAANDDERRGGRLAAA